MSKADFDGNAADPEDQINLSDGGSEQQEQGASQEEAEFHEVEDVQGIPFEFRSMKETTEMRAVRSVDPLGIARLVHPQEPVLAKCAIMWFWAGSIFLFFSSFLATPDVHTTVWDTSIQSSAIVDSSSVGVLGLPDAENVFSIMKIETAESTTCEFVGEHAWLSSDCSTVNGWDSHGPLNRSCSWSSNTLLNVSKPDELFVATRPLASGMTWTFSCNSSTTTVMAMQTRVLPQLAQGDFSVSVPRQAVQFPAVFEAEALYQTVDPLATFGLLTHTLRPISGRSSPSSVKVTGARLATIISPVELSSVLTRALAYIGALTGILAFLKTVLPKLSICLAPFRNGYYLEHKKLAQSPVPLFFALIDVLVGCISFFFVFFSIFVTSVENDRLQELQYVCLVVFVVMVVSEVGFLFVKAAIRCGRFSPNPRTEVFFWWFGRIFHVLAPIMWVYIRLFAQGVAPSRLMGAKINTLEASPAVITRGDVCTGILMIINVLHPVLGIPNSVEVPKSAPCKSRSENLGRSCARYCYSCPCSCPEYCYHREVERKSSSRDIANESTAVRNPLDDQPRLSELPSINRHS